MPQMARIGTLMSAKRGVSVPAPPWSPTDLGATLLGWLVADDVSPGSVASWVDRVAGYNFTAAGAEQPTASATSYNGNPGVTFNGTANCLTLASQPFPSAGNSCTIWMVADQVAVPGDATTRAIFCYGGDTAATQRRLVRAVVTGANVLRSSANAGNAVATGDFSGRHYGRGSTFATGTQASLDGAPIVNVAATPNTGTSRCRIGALADVAAANFFNGVIREIVLTGALTAQNITDMNNYLATRV